jgi:6-phosphofructokinase 1
MTHIDDAHESEYQNGSHRPQQAELAISELGTRRIPSPLHVGLGEDSPRADYVADDERVLFEPRFRAGEQLDLLAFEHAGPRGELFFNPAEVTAAVVTCGGLCPGINNVIRSLVFELVYNYGVRRVWGIRYGFRGLNPDNSRSPLELTPQLVSGIHHQGGTFLGTSRGGQNPQETVERLVSLGVNMLFCIGGDGTQRGAHAIADAIKARELPIAVVGIPKTIDNDVRFCFRTFGFFTAVAEAEKVIDRAHVEAKSVENGVGLVKLMGREAGFIAAAAALASGEANFCLIPEVPFGLTGQSGFLEKLKRRLLAREHAVVVVAEGAGQDLISASGAGELGFDASGNRRLNDIGYFLKEQIGDYFAAEGIPVSVKYFDPSYEIRSVPASAVDSLLCDRFARAAAHAAMAGKTDLLIGLWHNHLIHVPLELSTGEKKRLDPRSELWRAVLASTGQDKW